MKEKPPVIEPPKPVKLPALQAVGKLIRCPDCGAEALVEHARGFRTAMQELPSAVWVMLRCRGFCGSKLIKAGDAVQLAVKPTPEPVRKPLGTVVGRWVKCPIQDCGERSRAAWDADDDGHVVQCPVHRNVHYDPEMMVEVM